MSGHAKKWLHTSPTAAAAAAVAAALTLGLGSVVLQAGIAGAAGAAGSPRAVGLTAAHPARHKSHGGGLPKVAHATDLSAEPVVHADKGAGPTKLLVKDLVAGKGAVATRQSTVKVKYVGAAYKTGQIFTAATWTQHEATTFSLAGGVIPGFTDGIAGMRVGGRREIVIPPKLGYGRHADGPIKANETLVFVVDLVGVTK